MVSLITAVIGFLTVLDRALLSSSVIAEQAVITTCIPATLGSETFRKDQIWQYSSGKITQPGNPGLCLTTTTKVTVQNAPGLMMLPCAAATADPVLAANQTWELSPHGQIKQHGDCIDVAGYGSVPDSALHLWTCTSTDPGPAPPATDKNQLWAWSDDGSVHTLLSNLCLSASAHLHSMKTCENRPWNTSKFCDKSLSPANRAQLLVSETNLTEQIENLAVGMPGYPRLGIHAPTFGEALHGVCTKCHQPYTNNLTGYTSTGCATSFPHALSMASTFNRTLWTAVGNVIGREGRAMHNQDRSVAVAFFAPNINLYRDPRWGRGMEVPGEDPFTTGEYGRHFVRAMQAKSADGRTQRVVASPKHFVDYDLEGRHDAFSPNWGPSRNDFNAIVSQQEQVEYFLPAWHSTIKAGEAGSLMCSTNRVNGIDSCMNPTYLDGFLRGLFNFTGYVVTDGNCCGNPNCEATVALKNASAGWGVEGHEIAAELCLDAGTDVELGKTLTTYTGGAVAGGLVRESTVARSNVRLYTEFIRSGFLDATADDALGPADIDTPTSRQLAYEAATDAMVLLKNDGGVLPLTSQGAGLKVALVGPHLNSTADLLTSLAYAGENTLVLNNTIEAAFQRRAKASGGALEIVGAAEGCDIVVGCPEVDTAAITAAVANADVVVALVGLHPSSGAPSYPGYGTACAESEAWDRGDIALCGQQQLLLETALARGKPLVTVLINGGTISASWIKEHSTAVVEGWYPGQAGGEAVVSVLFGDRPPTGRLPVTIYDESFIAHRNSSAHNITDMSLRSVDGVTYMHYTGTPLWPFGFGLSYTTWSVSTAGRRTGNEHRDAVRETSNGGLVVTTAALAADYAAYYRPPVPAPAVMSTSVVAAVTNTGKTQSGVVVQVFASRATPPPPGSVAPPRRQLVGFNRAADIAPGTSHNIVVELAPLALCRVDAGGNQWAEPGTWVLQTTVDGVTMVNTTLTVTGTRIQVLAWPTP
eukprot:m.1156162 g.1156162  ORF g.1156162 m.1156162 type:complete len:985 (+) comp24492_c0_seq2:78-3032(+)